MSQSLLVSTPGGNSAKRQRSADGRDLHSRPASAGQNVSSHASVKSEKPLLKPNFRMPPYLEKSRSEILAAFQEIEWKQRFRLFHAMEHPDSSPYKVDRSAVVVSRNRYANVQPWDASRIKLKTPIGGSDYVNASPIVLRSRNLGVKNGTDSSSPLEVRYIATQGPKEGQKSHFWHLVHQETTGDTAVVIMLTQLIEENKEKCTQYYPLDLADPTMTLTREEHEPGGLEADEFDDGVEDTSSTPPQRPEQERAAPSSSDTITLLSKEFDESVGCEVRKLLLTIDDVTKTVIHYLFARWPDFGKPEPADRKALIEMSRRSYLEAGNSPRIVHCSAGVGRTGTWIALDFLVREVQEGRLFDHVSTDTESAAEKAPSTPLEEYEFETWGKSGPPKVRTPTQDEAPAKDEQDLIFETVNSLREQRMMMVMRDVQFMFLYEAVREAVLEKYHAEPEGPMIKDGSEVELRPRGHKALKMSDEHDAAESPSEAETEIIPPDNQHESGDDDDPYSAVSPDNVRQGMS